MIVPYYLDEKDYHAELTGENFCFRCRKQFVDFADNEPCSYPDCDRMEYPQKKLLNRIEETSNDQG
jgi:hypothetical protein